ncbi:hypothetical protein [Leptolyngbya sp. 'hensonii']|uniref:hypothetical protein n=1 Tax=Leptolyngbya sp. 'hensonii' TaxID=1922337 RepID=UPI000ACBAF60|nr:hypothetical protein [Leptolyngbya sp. 'hensonii']
MSSIVEKAIVFYLSHPEIVDEVASGQSSYGQAHAVHSCPECATSVVVREGTLVALGGQATFLAESETSLSVKDAQRVSGSDKQGEEELVPC